MLLWRARGPHGRLSFIFGILIVLFGLSSSFPTTGLAPIAVAAAPSVIAIAAGWGNGYALKSDGTVWAWGGNPDGELGNGTTVDSSDIPVQVYGLTGVTAIAGGYALKSDGTVWAWGDNSNGGLGNATVKKFSDVPVQVLGLDDVTAIGDGLALRSDGTVWTWGQGDNEPAQIPGLTQVTAIAGDAFDGYALASDGTVWAWGDNSDGELGNGTNIPGSDVPVKVSGLTHIIAISDGFAVKSDGTVWTWGFNADGELGNGSTIQSSNVPVQVSGLAGITAIAGNGFTRWALKSDGTEWAWGSNLDSQLGNGSTEANSDVPVQVSGLTGVRAIAGGEANGYALKSDGTVWSWGDNGAQATFFTGALGNGSTIGYSNVPVQVLFTNFGGFNDLGDAGWAEEAINALAEHAYVNGVAPGSFAPDAPLTRAQFAKFLVLADGLTVGSPSGVSFSDVTATDWFAPYVAAAYQAGLVKGTTAAAFSPNDPLTQEQMLVMLSRLLGPKASESDSGAVNGFYDLDPWAQRGVSAAMNANILNGFPAGSFQPRNPATRAQAAQAIFNYLHGIGKL